MVPTAASGDKAPLCPSRGARRIVIRVGDRAEEGGATRAMSTARRSAGVVLGISHGYHDAAAAVVVDGRVMAAAEEERFSRIKHDPSFPRSAIEACLRVAGLDAAAVDVVALHERPLDVVSRYLASRQRMGPRGVVSFVADAPRLLRQHVAVERHVEGALRDLGRRARVPIRYSSHHRSHAAAAFLPSPFEHAAIVTLDGIGEWATASIGRGAHRSVELLEELRYPDSLGLVYSFVTAYCGFRPNADESKLMGLAPYGVPRFMDELSSLATLGDDGSLRVDARALGWFVGAPPRRLRRLFDGPPRRPGDPLTPREADLAASVQRLCELAVLRIASRAHRLTGERHLALAGGVALNCVANGRLLREGPFEEIWIQPAAGDAGSAVGAALSTWHDTMGNPRATTSGAAPAGATADSMAGAFLGPRVRTDEVDRWVAAIGADTTAVPDPARRAHLVAERLAAGDVVGWFSGRMEFGPRALGHRSILADPRSTSVRERINRDVKRREDFRPFAPAVLAADAAHWFDLDAASPYMLLVARVRPEHLVAVDDEPEGIDARARVARSTIPACTHVDGTARVQTVGEENSELHPLLTAFRDVTGCGVLLNTSFNVAGEPIVATPADALRSAVAGGLDLLVVEHHIFERAALDASAAVA